MERKDKKQAKVIKKVSKIADKVLEGFGGFCKSYANRYHNDGLSYGCDLYFTSKGKDNPKDRKNPDMYSWCYAQGNMELQDVTYIGRINGDGLMYKYPDADEINSDFKDYSEEEIDEHFIDSIMESFWESDDLWELRKALIYFMVAGEIE